MGVPRSEFKHVSYSACWHTPDFGHRRLLFLKSPERFRIPADRRSLALAFVLPKPKLVLHEPRSPESMVSIGFPICPLGLIRSRQPKKLLKPTCKPVSCCR